MHHAEQQLRSSGVPATFVRAAYFVENWGTVVQLVKADGVLPSFIAADQRVPSLSTVDIGKAIAQALLDGPRGVRVIELSAKRREPLRARPLQRSKLRLLQPSNANLLQPHSIQSLHPGARRNTVTESRL